jgi:hypothetical protein
MFARRRRWMPFRQPFLMAGERFIENTISCRIESIYIKPRQRALGQTLRMAVHASDWGDSLKRRHRGGEANGTPW